MNNSNGHRPSVDGWARALAAFEGKRVLVVGDVMLDRASAGNARRISPEAPVPVLTIERESAELGGAGNVARNLVALGASVALAGAVGDDEPGADVRALCRDRAIGDSALLTVPERPTSVKTRYLAGTQQVLRVDRECDAPLPPEREGRLIETLRANTEPLGAVVVSDYAKGVVTDAVIAAAIGLARAHNAPCVVDPKGARFERYAGCTAITPNADEAAAATGLPARSDGECGSAAERLLRVVRCQAVVITRGRSGVTLRTQENAWRLPSRAREVFDVTGAGDTLVAALALARSGGLSWPDSVFLANIAAGLVVEQRGAAVTSREALLEALSAIELGDAGRTVAA